MAGQVNIPQFQTLDYGRAVKTRQDIDYNRMRNEVTGMELEEQRNILANRKKAQEIRGKFEATPEQIDGLEREGLYEEAQKLRDTYLSQAYNEVKLIESMREAINADNYKQVRSDMIKAGAMDGSMMPVEYSDAWFRKQAETKRGNLQKLTRKWATEGVTMAQDLVAQDGSILWKGEPYKAPGGKDEGDGDGFSMKAADSNSIANLTARLYSTMWDPVSQQYQGLNKTQQLEAASIAEEASRIYRESQGRVGHQEAVVRAARKRRSKTGETEGIDVQQITPQQEPNWNILNLPVNAPNAQ